MTPIPAPPTELESVARLFPAFEFEGLVAHGESGSIFKARHRSLDRDVAIKIIPREPGMDHSDKTGAKMMACLNHPNLIRVYDSGEAGGYFFMVMEYVPGKSLEFCASGKAINPKQACEIIIAVCEGLAHAHANGVIHGGMNPSNILLNAKCEPKISNFGNTPCDEGNAGAQMDVFALGLILRELLTGVSRNSSNAASAIVPDMKLAMICRKATHPDPERRYADASALSEALTRAMMPANHTTPAKNQQSALQRQKPVLATGGSDQSNAAFGRCAVIALLLFSIFGVWGLGQAKQERITRLQKEEDAKPKIVVVNAARSDDASNTALVRWE